MYGGNKEKNTSSKTIVNGNEKYFIQQAHQYKNPEIFCNIIRLCRSTLITRVLGIWKSGKSNRKVGDGRWNERVRLEENESRSAKTGQTRTEDTDLTTNILEGKVRGRPRKKL